jgi:hypothetical protein
VAFAGNLVSEEDYSGSFCCSIQDEMNHEWKNLLWVCGFYSVFQ